MNNILTSDFLFLWPFGLYCIVFIGLLFYFNNLIRLLILLELFILSNSVLLVVLVYFKGAVAVELYGSIPIFLATAAADAAVGLGILVVLYRQRKNLHPAKIVHTSKKTSDINDH